MLPGSPFRTGLIGESARKWAACRSLRVRRWRHCCANSPQRRKAATWLTGKATVIFLAGRSGTLAMNLACCRASKIWRITCGANFDPPLIPLQEYRAWSGQHREYLIYFGSLDIVPSLSRYPPWGLSPNLWWPEDRSWCVATEIDSYDTFVGGSAACIERILNCPDLEALPFPIDGRIDGDADMVNT